MPFPPARPWLAHYAAGIPASLALPQGDLAAALERTAHHRPGQVAIHYLAGESSIDRTISFRELDDLASRFAAVLAGWGVGEGDRVAICTQNDPEFLVAQFGAWKRAAIVVPLNPMFKTRELAYHLADSGARVFVCLDDVFESQGREAIAATAVEHVLTTPAAFQSALDAARPDPAHRTHAPPDSTAQLVYTSGTTGNPKGAIGTHRNILYNAEVFRLWMNLGEGDKILGAAPLFHVTGLVAEIATAVLTGIPLVLFHRFDTATCLRMAAQHRTTFMVAAITAYIALMNDPAATPNAFASMTKCYSGGAPVAPPVVTEFQSKLGAYIHNIYGLTESNSPSHATPLGAKAPVDPASGALSIGLPIPGLDAKIVHLTDPSKDLPPGEPGELAMRGPMMTPGYWNKPEATRDAFHEGWFLTGDVAVMDAEGWFYIVDRKKDMIVASGFKVWPRDVEDVLYQHPAVREAAVIGVPDPYRGETVKAFVALKAGCEADSGELIAFCRERMAAYKYPRQVEFLPEIPKTASGKFLRRQLR
ncbi:MAG: AMP-binding protein [Bryobacteraceae bacterium]